MFSAKYNIFTKSTINKNTIKLKNELNLPLEEILEQYTSKIGQKLEFTIIDIDEEKQRIALSNNIGPSPQNFVGEVNNDLKALDGLKKRPREEARKGQKTEKKCRKDAEKEESSVSEPDESIFVDETDMRKRIQLVERLEENFGNFENRGDLFGEYFENKNDNFDVFLHEFVHINKC